MQWPARHRKSVAQALRASEVTEAIGLRSLKKLQKISKIGAVAKW